ncbi:ditrans,polycis-polyprenyl diphosphate synthase [(2E,6E)-farnesydiphosphate specific] [Malassezia nana]|uniref:Alkyl transferase n=1 Tax=Malassezia nana TaxID=180528 RepID=A0AAF0EJ46_9BASI|nr:ditrans,polycis-polyprenyl diphosphate synthase [(2E,6E)-farnesydiphosphate specific] [Malassezia nana]
MNTGDPLDTLPVQSPVDAAETQKETREDDVQVSMPSIPHLSKAWWYGCLDGLFRFALQSLSLGPLPRHIAFIMDGNRRWSRLSGVKIRDGHYMGFEALKRVLELCLSLRRIDMVTVYAFALDNFRRDPEEVAALMELARTRLLELTNHSDLIRKFSVRVRVVGRRALLPPGVQETARRVEEATKDHTGPTLNVCMPYASQDEICEAATQAARQGDLTEATLAEHLMVPCDIPVDVLVRTSHVSRLSDFLLWQCNEQTQIHFVDQYWPQFGARDLIPILLAYQRARS